MGVGLLCKAMSKPMRSQLIRKVAAQTMRWNFRVWGFGESVALRGLLQASRVTGDAEPLGYVKALLRFYIGHGVAKSPEDHVAPGAELLLIYEETGELIFLEAAKKLADLHRNFPQNNQGARVHRADLQGWRRQIWVDCMDVEAPFLARLGTVTRGEILYAGRGRDNLLRQPSTGQSDRSFFSRI